MNNHITVLAGVWALGLAPHVQAQTRPADPSQARQPAAELRYESALADYKPWQDAKPGDWRAINDALLKGAAAGGHTGHGAAPSAAKPAGPAASTPAAKPAAAASAAPSGGHGAHGSHK